MSTPPLSCRSCGRSGLELVLSLGKMALANALLTDEQLLEPEPIYPLDLATCPACSLAQITEVIDPEVLFSDYTYFSSYSDTMLAHAEGLVERLVGERDLGPASLAVELASNDGYLLQYYVRGGVPVLGIDPAANVVEAAEARGVPTLCAFFGAELAETLRKQGRRADVLHANNVIAHVADLNGFVTGIGRLLADDGIAVIETPYVRELIDRLEFDTIYHEHLYYYSATSLGRVLRRNGLELVDVERIPIHGGSLRVFAAPAGSAPVAPSVTALLEEEGAEGLDGVRAFSGFAARVDTLHAQLVSLLEERRRAGRRIAAYGAAAKGAVLLQAFEIGTETLEYVVDRSPHKQGHHMPGVHIPIVAPDRLLGDEPPDDVLLLAWNFADEIMEQQSEYRRRGGSFILPAPEPVVVGS